MRATWSLLVKGTLKASQMVESVSDPNSYHQWYLYSSTQNRQTDLWQRRQPSLQQWRVHFWSENNFTCSIHTGCIVDSTAMRIVVIAFIWLRSSSSRVLLTKLWLYTQLIGYTLCLKGCEQHLYRLLVNTRWDHLLAFLPKPVDRIGWLLWFDFQRSVLKLTSATQWTIICSVQGNSQRSPSNVSRILAFLYFCVHIGLGNYPNISPRWHDFLFGIMSRVHI